MKKFLAGAAKVNITPPVGAPLSGYTVRKDVSQGIHDDLYAKALVLDNGEKVLAIVTTDLLGFYDNFVDKVRNLIKKQTGIDKNNILISATHTHSAPDTLYGLYSQGRSSDSWMDVLAQKIAGCVYMAWRNRKEARIGTGKGSVQIGVNRRNPDGKPIDPEVGVLRVDDIEGNLMAVVINYTCHAVVLGPDNLLISADYPGYTMRMIEKLKGENVVAMFTNGAEGDINTGHSADISGIGGCIPGRTFERAEKLGNILGGEVLKVLEQIKVSPKVHLDVKKKIVELPLKTLPSLEEAEKELKKKASTLNKLKKASREEITRAKIEKFYAEITLSMVREIEDLGLRKTMKAEIQAMRLNDTILIAFPGELFVEIGLEIKKDSDFKNTFIVGLANGEIGYIPTHQAFVEGGYESISTKFTGEAENIIKDTVLKLIKEIRRVS
ncbi:neutral/alkaline non-lysosomal ceramidase N-terminal domain-containing protein [Candidatus Aerophobetes bacterium]|nr:neutral/alkaline non-lysosomal ceramidase N-terminal domain-containing protein [Candidatus Aerophobetes bacterium]